MSAQRVDQLRLLSNQRLAHPVDRQRALLFLGLDRNKPHARPLHRLADRLGVGPVVLLTLHVRLDVLRRHQPHRMTGWRRTPAPRLAAAASSQPLCRERRRHRTISLMKTSAPSYGTAVPE